MKEMRYSINFTQSRKKQGKWVSKVKPESRCPNPYRSCQEQESTSVGLRSCPSCCFVPKRINFVLSGLIINWCSQSHSTTRWRSWETLANSRSVSKDLKERNSLVSYRPCKIQFHNLRRYSAIHWCKVWTIRDRESIIGELHNDR